jgi:hypothetical protein
METSTLTAVTALVVAVGGLLGVLLAILKQLQETHAMLNSRWDQVVEATKIAATLEERALHPRQEEEPSPPLPGAA